MSKYKVKVDCENCVFYDQQMQQKDQRIAKLEKELHKYFVDNESLAEQLRTVSENNLFKEREKQTAVKEFADKIKDINFVDYCEIRNYDQIKYVWFNYVSFNVKINKLLKEKGIE